MWKSYSSFSGKFSSKKWWKISFKNYFRSTISPTHIIYMIFRMVSFRATFVVLFYRYHTLLTCPKLMICKMLFTFSTITLVYSIYNKFYPTKCMTTFNTNFLVYYLLWVFLMWKSYSTFSDKNGHFFDSKIDFFIQKLHFLFKIWQINSQNLLKIWFKKYFCSTISATLIKYVFFRMPPIRATFLVLSRYTTLQYPCQNRRFVQNSTLLIYSFDNISPI